MKTLFTLLLGFLILPGHAQQSLPAKRLATHADSVATLRQVFRLHRRIGRVRALSVGPSLGFGIAEVAVATSAHQRILSSVALGACTAYVVVGVVNWQRYSKRQEEVAVHRFEQHQLQPRYLRKRLLRAFNH